MVHKKRPSKRLSLKDKYKIQKKMKEHHRKVRKEARKNPNKRKKLAKDPGVPNLFPYKDVLIQKALKQRDEREQQKQGMKRKRSDEEQMQELAKSAQKRNRQFDDREELTPLGSFNLKDSSKKVFFREFKKVVKQADVILEVLDARDPLGSRSPTVERQILEMDPNKKIILVLNKIDLIPKDNTEKWLSYLRNEYPTIAFKASTQRTGVISQAKTSAMELSEHQIRTMNECLGADTLLQLLKNYSRSLKIKKNITVGIIGFPNVGKSSLINSLKRARAVGTGSRPGITRQSQTVILDKNITLLDCPGIIFSTDMSEADAALRNCLQIEQIQDHMLPIQAILRRVSKEALVQIYKIPMFTDAAELLRAIATKRGKVRHGGVLDTEGAAKVLIMDWNSGRIPYYTVPPELDEGVHLGAQVVSSWSAEFNLDSVLALEKQSVMANLKTDDSLAFATALPSSGPLNPAAEFSMLAQGGTEVDMEDADDSDDSDDGDAMDDEDDEEDDEEESEEKMEVEKKSKTGETAIAKIRHKKHDIEERPTKRRRSEETDVELPRVNLETKRAFKEEKRAQRKEEAILRSTQPQDTGEAYDFGVDFWKGEPPVLNKRTDDDIDLSDA